jgi:3-oxoacyl-[acyl-carrier protein] reductase
MPTIIARAGMPDNEETRTKMTGVIPLGRLCKPSDIGNACCFLASDEADYITGAQLGVDGGRAI